MALKYTGRSDTFVFNDKVYARNKAAYMAEHNGVEPDGTYDNAIPGLSKATALHMMEASNLHSFEEAGEDLMEKVTAPPVVKDK